MFKKKGGFTLIELLVTISIIAILSVVGLVVFQNAQKSARDAKIKADLNAIKKAYETNFDPTANGGQGGYRELRTTDFAGNQIPGPYTYEYGPNAASPENDGYQVSATLSDRKPIYASSTQGTLASQGTLGTCDPAGTLNNGLVGYWKMDESSGTTTVADYSGNGITATSNSPTNVDTGKFGNARTFNGTDNYISIPDVTSLRFGSGLTLSVWLNINSGGSGYRELVSRGYYPSGWDVVIDPGGMDFRSSCLGTPPGEGTDNYLDTGLSVGSGWHHFVITFDSAAQKITTYRDGSQIASKTQTGSLCTSPGGNTIGLRQGAFWGLMDDLRIYNRALSQSEISLLASGCVAP